MAEQNGAGAVNMIWERSPVTSSTLEAIRTARPAGCHSGRSTRRETTNIDQPIKFGADEQHAALAALEPAIRAAARVLDDAGALFLRTEIEALLSECSAMDNWPATLYVAIQLVGWTAMAAADATGLKTDVFLDQLFAAAHQGTDIAGDTSPDN